MFELRPTLCCAFKLVGVDGYGSLLAGMPRYRLSETGFLADQENFISGFVYSSIFPTAEATKFSTAPIFQEALTKV